MTTAPRRTWAPRPGLPDESAFFFTTSVGADHERVCRSTDPSTGAYEVVLDQGWSTSVGLDWAGRHLLVVWNEDGWSRAELRDPHRLAVTAELPLPADGVLSGVRFTRDGRFLFYGLSAPTIPGDAWRYDTDTGETVRLTRSPCDVDDATFVTPETVRFTSFDGLEVPAFVYRPRDATVGRRPVLVMVHGGPESQARPAFNPLVQYFVARGFAVVQPNVRGSTGYGRRYQHLDDVEKRLDSVADLAALHDWIAASDDLDPERCALMGGSYGGYMTLAGLAFQPDRWAAGVDIVGIASLVTFLENTSPYRREFREREYGSLAHHRDLLVEISPLTHVDQMRAPLLVIHGANDPRVPLSEAEQVHAALRGKGQRCDLLVYPDEGHGLAKLKNRLDAYPKVADFLEETLGP